MSFFSCESDKIEIISYGSIDGTVLDGETYLAVQGALITTTPASIAVLSDVNGKFSIPKIKEGEVSVSVKKKDYLINSLTVAIFEKENTPMNLLIFKDNKSIGNIVIYDPVPGNGAVDQNNSITFKWKVEGMNASIKLSYNVFIFESNSTVQILLGENLENLEVTTNNLNLGTTYYWYVVAKYEGTKIAFSPTWSFKTRDK